MVGAVETLFEQLQLPHMAAVLSDHLERAAHEELSYGDFLRGLLQGRAWHDHDVVSTDDEGEGAADRGGEGPRALGG